MRNKTVRIFLTTAALLATVLSATTASAAWYVNQSEAYYVPQEYHNEKFGNFPPTDIDQKLFGHLNTEAAAEEKKPLTANAPTTTYNNPPAQARNQQRPNPQSPSPVQNYQRPAYGNYNQGRNYAPPGNQRYNRNTSFNGPWNNNQSSFSGPWNNNNNRNNNGSSFSGPWNNNNGSSFGGPWNNNGSSFSGPWNNNGSSFSMPWGNNNGSRSGFNPMGNGGSWGW